MENKHSDIVVEELREEVHAEKVIDGKTIIVMNDSGVVKAYKCKTCGLVIKGPIDMMRHIENDHKYSCNQCNYTAVNKNELLNHT